MIDEIREIFPDARIHGGYARVRCPFHKGGEEKNASMGILLQDKNGLPRGFVKCFTCGWTGTVTELFRQLGYQYIETTQDEPETSFVQLETRRHYHKSQLPYRRSEYLESRGIGERVQQLFKVYEKDGKVYLPVFSRDGKYLYANARSTSSRAYFIESGAQKTLACIEEIDTAKPIWIVEGQIDAFTLWQLGLQAVATLSSTNVNALHQIANAREIILALDNDEAGIRGAYKAVDIFGSFRCKYLELPAGVDVNDVLCHMLASGKTQQEAKDYLLTHIRPQMPYAFPV